MDKFFYLTYDSILKKLGREDEGYVELEGGVDKLTKKYSLIEHLREGKAVNTEATRTIK